MNNNNSNRNNSSNLCIVVGGGLSGCSAAHTVLERGGRVILLDKNPFLGGNSVKATSGINGTPTKAQWKLDIKDSVEAFAEDTAISASKGQSKEIYPLGKVLTHQSGAAVEWLIDAFNLDLSKVSRLGGHSFPRTHRGPERFPGMTITYALMEKLEDISKKDPQLAQVVTKARVNKLLTGEQGQIIGVEYEKLGGDGGSEVVYGSTVILATGGYAADFSKDGILAKVRPDLLGYSTTNGDHCTGDGIKIASAIGADAVDLEYVQVHPTGLVNPKDPKAKVKFLAAEALRGVGGLLLDRHGKRFCNDLGTRDYVSGMMEKNEGPFRLVLNHAASSEIMWHCKHYQGRGLMKHFNSGDELAREIGVSPSVLRKTFDEYNEASRTGKDKYGLKYFLKDGYKMDDDFYVAVVCPVVHYCMGGLKISVDAEVLDKQGRAIPGLYCTGELCGGVHGKNRLGGSSLLDCVVFGRVSGATATKYMLKKFVTENARTSSSSGDGGGVGDFGIVLDHHGLTKTVVSLDPHQKRLTFDVSWNGDGENKGRKVTSTTRNQAAATRTVAADTSTSTASIPEDLLEEKNAKNASSSSTTTTPTTTSSSTGGGKKVYTREEVSKHNKETDCWVIVNGEVLNATNFLKDHPGGKDAIMLFAGKEATDEFNMIHKKDVVEKYAPYTIIGTIAPESTSVSHSHTRGTVMFPTKSRL